MREAIQVPPDAAGERLDHHLAAPLGSRSRAQKLIDNGRVLVDGRPRGKSHVLQGGERIVVREAPQSAGTSGESVPFEIVYEDEALFVVDKPAGVVVHPAPGYRHATLADALRARGAAGGEPDRQGIVHRLDRDTSGLLVVARSEVVLRALGTALRERRIEREYLVLVEGRPTARSGTIDAPLGRDRRVRSRVSSDTDRPREARTHFEVERLLPRATLLRAHLETGRTHQIRAHFKAIGLPVAGDPEYGARDLYGLRRQFLHAARLAFEHPLTGEPLELDSPLPADLAAALERAAGAVP